MKAQSGYNITNRLTAARRERDELIITIGIISIIIITLCVFNKEKLTHKYFEYSIEKKYSSFTTNNYTISQILLIVK